MRHAAREMADIEIHDARADVPSRRLGIDAFERASELLLDSECHGIRQVLIEQLRMTDDHAFEMLRLHPPQEFLEPEHVLERPGPRFGAGWHDLGEDRDDESRNESGDRERNRSE